MKSLLSIVFSSKNSMKLVFCVLFSAASQPLIAWSFSGLTGTFLSQPPIYSVIIQNALLLIVALIAAWISNNLKADITYNSELTLRNRVFSSIYSIPIGDFDKKDSGSYYNQIGRNVQMLQTGLFESTIKIMIDVLTILFISALLLYCHWMSLIVILIFLVPLVIGNIVMPKKIGKYQDRSMHTLTSMVVKLKDVLSGFFTAKFQESEKYIEDTMHGYFFRSSSLEKRIANLNNLSALIAGASVTLSQFSGLFVAFYLMSKNQIDFAQFILIFQLGMGINGPLVDLINSCISIRAYRPYIQETEEILLNGFVKPDFLLKDIKEINFTNVSFTYPEKHRSVLCDFNYRFEKGKKYLLIGESGSGKTTLIKLLLGIIKPTQGAIFYDNIDQNELSHHEIYHHCTVVPQQVYVFDDTIRRNIDLRGECTDTQLQAIIQKAKLETFFAANHYTLDTEISNETLQVSGGEKARVGLARTLTQNKSIVIYDEVLSALDSQNAKLVEDLILSDNERITIHISHTSNPEFFERYDEIIRLNIPEE